MEILVFSDPMWKIGDGYGWKLRGLYEFARVRMIPVSDCWDESYEGAGLDRWWMAVYYGKYVVRSTSTTLCLAN